jgi:H2-forming N5,N10-methylenetetrahydromethanopterin dehydrogenase-like enzyme
LKKVILVNSLMNIQEKKNKFFFVDLHLKLLNEYVKKIMKNKRVSSFQFVAPDAQYASVLESMMNGVWIDD